MPDSIDNDAKYEELQQKLASANASAEAAEVHGVICGVIATGQTLPQSWFSELFDQAEDGDLLMQESRRLVNELFDTTLQQLNDAELGMHLLLPADDSALPIRAQAVTEWCQGFLYGIGLAGEQVEQLSVETRETLEDISAFTNMDVAALGDADNQEEEEEALMQITEFLWVAAMLIRDNFSDQNQSADGLSMETGVVDNDHEYH